MNHHSFSASERHYRVLNVYMRDMRAGQWLRHAGKSLNIHPHQYENPMSTKSCSTSTRKGPADTPNTPNTEDTKEVKMREVLTGIAKDPYQV